MLLKAESLPEEELPLDEGEMICEECDGKGWIQEDNKISRLCKKCHGTKKLTWVEDILGKENPNFNGYSGSSGYYGSTGVSGASGFVGTSGVSGASGFTLGSGYVISSGYTYPNPSIVSQPPTIIIPSNTYIPEENYNKLFTLKDIENYIEEAAEKTIEKIKEIFF